MKHVRIFILVVLLSLTLTTLFAVSNQQIVDSLEKTKALDVKEIFLGDALKEISEGSFYEARYGFQIPNANEDIFLTKYFIKENGVLTSFNTEFQLLCSEEFLNSIRPEFTLNCVEDGLLFQQFLYSVDENYFNEGFFIEGNKWIFVRDEFFGDIEAWIVETNENGTITNITHDYEADVILGDELYKTTDMGFIYETNEACPISQSDFNQINSVMLKEFLYEIDIDPITSQWLDRLSQADWYSCEISIEEEYEDMTSISYYEVFPFVCNGEIYIFDEIEELLSSSIFIQSVRLDFLLIDDESAEFFELALDEISDFTRGQKASFERNGLWNFIRRESFDDGWGYIVTTDEDGKIIKVEYSYTIPLEDVEVPIEEPFDESSVTWTFSLLEPTSKSIQIPEAEDIDVVIEFNDWAASKIGAWIGTFWEGELVGFYASTNMTSPYQDTIPGEVLSNGNNIIIYKLLRPGRDYDNPLASEIEISVWIGD